MMRRAGTLTAIVTTLLVASATPALAQTAPVIVGSVSNNGNLSGATSVAVYHSPSTGKDYAVTTAYWPGQLTVIDISNPASPTIVGATSADSTQLENASNVAISGNDAFVASKNRNTCTLPGCTNQLNDDGSGNSLTVVDLSNPASPTPLGTITEVNSSTNPGGPFGFYGVAVSGQNAYLAGQGIISTQPTTPDTSWGAFAVIGGISTPSSMTATASLDNASLPFKWTNALKHATSVQISGNYAYVTAFYDDRVTVIDISNPASPQVVASLRDATNLINPADLAVQGNYVYVANQGNAFTNQFTILDVSNPASPRVVSSLNDPSLAGAYRIRVRGDFAYVAASSANAEDVIDVSDPTNPRLVATVSSNTDFNATTGLDLDSSGRYLVASSLRLLGEATSPYPPFTNTTGTISVIDLEPSPFSVSIAAGSEPPSSTTQTSAGFSFSTSDDVAALQCSLDGAPAGPCTSPTTMSYSGLASGPHTFKVTATASTGTTSSDSYSWVIGAAPANTATPSAPRGTAVSGSTLTAVNGRWSGYPTPTLSDQWMRCNSRGGSCDAISGQTGSTYKLGSADVGHKIAVDVTASNSAGSAGPVRSATTAVVLSPLRTAVMHAALSQSSALTLTVTLSTRLGSVSAITVTPPKGIVFSAAHRRLANGIKVRGANGKRLRFKVAYENGDLVITLSTPAKGVTLTIAGRAMTVRSSYKKTLLQRHGAPLRLKLKLRFR